MQLLTSHPSRADLLAFAELLETDSGQASAAIHTHVSECDRCRAEVERARTTIALTRHAGQIEPSREWRAQMLLNARQVRGLRTFRTHRRLTVPTRRTVTAGTIFIVIAALSIAAVHYADANGVRFENANEPSRAAVFPLDVLKQATPEEKLLAPAVLSESSPATPWEASQHRAVHAWDAEIDEALDALESNPACVRAATLVNTNRERLGETLKVLYVERNY